MDAKTLHEPIKRLEMFQAEVAMEGCKYTTNHQEAMFSDRLGGCSKGALLNSYTLSYTSAFGTLGVRVVC